MGKTVRQVEVECINRGFFNMLILFMYPFCSGCVLSSIQNINISYFPVSYSQSPSVQYMGFPCILNKFILF